MSIKTIGIDLGQTACDVAARDGRGTVVSRRRLSRARLAAWLANLPPARIGMEARAALTTWRAGWPRAAMTCA